jgi:membrane-associated phospholipid phosphatase
VTPILACRTTAPLAGVALAAAILSGCMTDRATTTESAVRDAIEQYSARGFEPLVASETTSDESTSAQAASGFARGTRESDLNMSYFTLGIMPDSPESQPAASAPAAGPGVPAGYWRADVWHQMGHEAKAFGTRDLWRGFKTSFWDLENALALTAAMGASVAIRETGVDGTIRNRTHGDRQLGDAGEVIGILGNPGTHFAGTGVLWLASALTKDAEQHEVARALAEALTVTGITTLGLKATARTRDPDGQLYAWPSGHTSSTVAVAAVLNEYYGPWVGVPCFALAGLVGYERIDSREHDLSDVVFGAVLGYVVGTSIARDEKAQFPELWGMKVVPFTDIETGSSGLALMKSW